uniref:Gamma-glutamylcyclotransferase n=1 Tax=Cyprinus carpio TaxID=7962 RepID=A0A8C2IN91_CYPCA
SSFKCYTFFLSLSIISHCCVSKMSSSGCFMYFAYGTVFQDTRNCILKQCYYGKLVQEQVDEGVYSPLEVKVETKEGPLLCRTYKMNNFRPCLPSAQYKKVVCLEAQQNSLPQNYIQKLLGPHTIGARALTTITTLPYWIRLQTYRNDLHEMTFFFPKLIMSPNHK